MTNLRNVNSLFTYLKPHVTSCHCVFALFCFNCKVNFCLYVFCAGNTETCDDCGKVPATAAHWAWPNLATAGVRPSLARRAMDSTAEDSAGRELAVDVRTRWTSTVHRLSTDVSQDRMLLSFAPQSQYVWYTHTDTHIQTHTHTHLAHIYLRRFTPQ